MSSLDYRRCLKTIARYRKVFADNYGAAALKSRTRYLFRPDHRNGSDGKKIQAKREVESTLKSLQSALEGDLKSVEYIQRFAYGRIGPLRYLLLQPHLRFINQHTTDHPLLSSPISHPNHNSLKAGPPFPSRNEVVQGPLHPRRRARIFHKWWHNRVLEKILPPIPQTGLETLEGIASGSLLPSSSSSTSRITPRYVRRRAAKLLDEVPIMDKGENGLWTVRLSKWAASHPANLALPLMDERSSKWIELSTV